MPEPTHAAGHGTKVHASKATWRYYKERKLSVTDVFRLLRPFWKKGKCGVGDNEKWVAIVQWLKERGLLPKGSMAQDRAATVSRTATGGLRMKTKSHGWLFQPSQG